RHIHGPERGAALPPAQARDVGLHGRIQMARPAREIYRIEIEIVAVVVLPGQINVSVNDGNGGCVGFSHGSSDHGKSLFRHWGGTLGQSPAGGRKNIVLTRAMPR